MDEAAPHKLSTSALARVLGLPSQQAFATLKDYGWIRKLDDGWALTKKGEFEGGEYVHSKRYGRYIVWPPDITEHPLLRAMEDNRHLSATQLGKPYHLSARETNRVLAERGWIRHGDMGWELTTLGADQGGLQLENESSGTYYVVWPQSVAGETLLIEQLRLAEEIFRDSPNGEQDLFAAATEYPAPDGHQHAGKLALRVCHWLYLAGIAHAVKRPLPVPEELYGDFYLPRYQVFIECWDDTGSGLAARMKRRDIYQKLGFGVIDVEPDNSDSIDEHLTREMRKLGIRIY